jgi:VanZ family protein
MFPRRRGAVTAGVAALGVAVEVLQALMPFGRHAEFADLVADAIGIIAGLILVRLLAGPAKLPT